MISPDQLIQIIRYNVMDVVLLTGVYSVVQDCGEPDVIKADIVINERGIAFDRELAAKLIKLEEAALEPLCRDIKVATSGAIKRTDLNRVKFLLDWLTRKGVAMASLQRGDVENALAANSRLGADVRLVLEARLANCRITTSKLRTAIETCDSDGRLRNQLTYHGAHTARWSGRGMQPHNLPRPHSLLKEFSRQLPNVDNLDAFIKSMPPGLLWQMACLH